jgi:hypothetical protein
VTPENEPLPLDQKFTAELKEAFSTRLDTKPLVLDLDDFCQDNQGLDLLDRLRDDVGGDNFRATLFTIPGRCQLEWIDRMHHDRPWLQLVPHGYKHETSRECETWSIHTMRGYLRRLQGYGLVRGFKAPGWQLNQNIYDGLLEEGYWIADKVENRPMRPYGLLAYEIDEPRKIHGHIGHLGGHNANELSLIYGEIIAAWNRHKERLGPAATFGFASNDLNYTGTKNA